MKIPTRGPVLTGCTLVLALPVLQATYAGLDLNPGTLSFALGYSTEAQVAAWILVAAAAVFGLWVAARFVAGTLLESLRSPTLKGARTALAAAGAAALVSTLFTGATFQSVGIALILCLVASWNAEGTEEKDSTGRTHKVHG